MQYKRQRVFGTTPRDIKAINDNVESLWYKTFGNLSFADFEYQLQNKVNAIEKLGIDNSATITIMQGEIELKVEEGDVKSIIKQSPTEISIGFNQINPKVIITPNNFIINDEQGSVLITNGRLYAKAIYATNGNIALTILPYGLRTQNGGVQIVEDGMNGIGTVSTNNLYCDTIVCSSPPWVTNSEYSNHVYQNNQQFNQINNEFTNVGNQFNGVYQMIGALDARITALGG